MLRLEPPAGLKKIKSLPDQGESLEKAAAEKRVALTRKTDLYAGTGGAEDLWARHEWFKTTLSGGTVGFGGWWVQVSRELAGELTTVQAGQTGELRDYIKQARSVGGRLKRLLGR